MDETAIDGCAGRSFHEPGTENSLTVGGGDGELLRDDEVGEEHEEEAGGEAGVEVPLRPALDPPSGLRLAAHRLCSSLPALSLLTSMPLNYSSETAV